MPKKLEGKVAVITGGATAKLFVKEGAYVSSRLQASCGIRLPLKS